MAVSFSRFVENIKVENAFSVLVVARQLAAAGKRVIELEIGDSPFPTTTSAKLAGLSAIIGDQSHYCASAGVPDLRRVASDYLNSEYGLATTQENLVIAPGAKVFEMFFCETFLDPGDGVLVFSPYFPTYLPNIQRRGARVTLSELKQSRRFRPNLDDVERFLNTDPRPKGIFLNSPHNPTGGVATEQDLADLADLVRNRDVAVFSDEPYDRMVWEGRHHSIAAQPDMLDRSVCVYTFSKSHSMSGWRLGYAAAGVEIARRIGNLINTSLSCTPPMVQAAGVAALLNDDIESRRTMHAFRRKVEILVDGLRRIEGIECPPPAGTFYVFPSVAAICNRLRITSHGLAMYLLEAADDAMGVACLGGECFGDAGAGFLRFSCAEPDEALQEAVDFIPLALSRRNRVDAYLEARPEFRLEGEYQAR